MRECLTCKNWLRIKRFPDSGFCEAIPEHPVKKLRFQFEACEGYKGEAPRRSYRGDFREKSPSTWSNAKIYLEERNLTK